jgi:hypothetical protein
MLVEYNARAALCGRLAKLEPVSRDIWLAEAERWSRLAQTSMGAQGGEGGREALEGASQSVGDAAKEASYRLTISAQKFRLAEIDVLHFS